jgi:hypothetical protein
VEELSVGFNGNPSIFSTITSTGGGKGQNASDPAPCKSWRFRGWRFT